MKKIIYYLLLILPFIDLITSVNERFFTNFISIGTIFKALLLVFSYFYIFFITKSKYKKYSIYYYISIVVFCLLYIITKGSINYLTEITFLIKFLFYPIILVFLYNYNEEYKIDYNEIVKLLKYTTLFICITILISYITNTGFNSYDNSGGLGAVGWYFSANEVGTIMALILPFFLISLLKNKKINLVYTIIVIFTMLILGTKTSYLGILIPLILLIIFMLIKERTYKNIITFSLILIFVLLLSPNSNVINNINSKSNSSAANLVFSAREIYLNDITGIYIDSDLDDKLLGIGFYNRSEINNYKIEKAIEMDFYDIFFRYGIIGTVIYFIPIGFLILYMLYYAIKYIKNYDLNIITPVYSTGIGFLIALLAGHTFSAPFVSIYLSIIMILFVIKIQENKINFH